MFKAKVCYAPLAFVFGIVSTSSLKLTIKPLHKKTNGKLSTSNERTGTRRVKRSVGNAKMLYYISRAITPG